MGSRPDEVRQVGSAGSILGGIIAETALWFYLEDLCLANIRD